MTADVAPAAGERGEDVTETGVRAVAAHHRAHTASGEETVLVIDVETGVAAKEPAALAGHAGVGGETAFELNADRGAVIKTFFRLEAEAGADVLTGHHGEGVGFRPANRLHVLVIETLVNHAIDLGAGSESGGGESAGRREDECRELEIHDV